MTSHLFSKVYGDVEQLQGSTLIVPAVSIGNVPQLAVDLLIHNFEFEKVASLEDQYLYPFASPVDYVDKPKPGISTALELYYSKKHSLTLIQQRSPIIPTFAQQFAKDIIALITELKFKNVIIMDSGDSGLREDITPSFIEVYTNEDFLSKSLESLRVSEVLLSLEDLKYGHSKYVKHLIDEIKTDLLVFVIYVYEGENFYEATVLADKVSKKLGLDNPPQWAKPVSWKGVYGDKPVPNAMEEGIYG